MATQTKSPSPMNTPTAKESTKETSQYTWVPKSRSYDETVPSVVKAIPPTDFHPLKGAFETATASSKTRTSSIRSTGDPLLNNDDEGDMDPLSKMVANVSLKNKQEILKQNEIRSSFEPWSFKKSGIMAKYTTVEKLSITSSFLTPIAGAVKEKTLNTKNLTTVSDKIKDRLEQLDQFDDDNMQEMANLSQQEYIKRIDELNNALQQAWAEDERVKSLKIVIQCSKLLADTSAIQFYPSKFVLITDILDTFGKLVYERIRTKSLYFSPGSSKAQPLPEKFTADIVPATAKETCRNWFFKIASIRELLPRIYVETAILKCNNFLSNETIAKPINRLISMTAGIGDPLVTAYANCYICRVGVSIDMTIKDYQMLSLDNLLFVFKQQISSTVVKKLLTNQKVSLKVYLELYCPAIDWILQCVCNNRPVEYMNEILVKCITVSNENRLISGLLINSMMSSLDPNFISTMAGKMIELIKEVDDDYFPKYLLFRNLGMFLVFSETSTSLSSKESKERNKQGLQMLNDVWKIVAKFPETGNYMSCAEIWIEYTLKNFTKKEINTLLGDIIKHVTPDRIFENFYPQLQSIVTKILVYITDFNILFSMDKFLQFISLFQKDSVKLEVCKSIMHAFLRRNNDFRNDVVITNSMIQICKSMHDYVNALTLEDEVREISQMICAFINKLGIIDKDEIEQYLNFYSEARASFSNLDGVISLLVHKVNHLAMVTLQIVNYNHTRKTASFVRACVAYSFITIPSLSNPMNKLQLYLESAQVALLNQCLSQSDAFLKSAISLIPDIQEQMEANSVVNVNTSLLNFDGSANIARAANIQNIVSLVETFLNGYLSNMMSTLLVIPDNPEQGVLYLLMGVLNLVEKHVHLENQEIKFNLLANVLVILSASKQETYLYHANNVDSNDTLYGSDPKYFKEINKTLSSVIKEILCLLSSFNPKKQAQLALEFFNRLIAHADLTNEQTLQLAANLWNLVIQNQPNVKFQEQIISTIKYRAQRREEFRVLQNKLAIK